MADASRTEDQAASARTLSIVQSSSVRSLRLGVAACVAGCAAIAVSIFFGARFIATSHGAPEWKPPPGARVLELHVPHAKGNIMLDGDMDDPGWLGPIARTNAFIGEDGVNPARPYSDTRLVWGDGHLYLALYAADEDIRATHAEPDGPIWIDDSFHLLFDHGGAERVFDVSPLGVLTDATRSAAPGLVKPFDYTWESGAHISKELDGTLNDPSDDDEEWVIEMAIPFEALGLKGEPGERIGFSVRRCDTPKSRRRACGQWGAGAERGVLVLD
jgi:Carbohydrate family 9 binding domain-like